VFIVFRLEVKPILHDSFYNYVSIVVSSKGVELG